MKQFCAVHVGGNVVHGAMARCLKRLWGSVTGERVVCTLCEYGSNTCRGGRRRLVVR